MKSLIRWGITLGLAIGITFTSYLGLNYPSLALPESEVVQKLQQIPMFIIVNQDGSLVLISPKSNQESAKSPPNLFIFVDYSDASKVLENLKKNNSELSAKMQIIPIAFSRVYEMLKTPEQDQNKIPPITIYSQEEAIVSAKKILQERGENTENLEKLGLPLFFVTLGKDNEFIVQRDSQGNNFIPFYMDLKEAQAIFELYKKQFPDRNPQDLSIKVIPLLQFVQVLLQKDEEAMKIMEIVPSEQQVNEANKLLQNLNSTNQNLTPTPN